MKSFAKGSFQTDLTSIKLGDMDLRLKESNKSNLFFIFGISVDNDIVPSDAQINLLMESLENTWLNSSNYATKVLNLSLIPKIEFDQCVKEFENLVLNHSIESTDIVKSGIQDWMLLPKQTQKQLLKIIENIILGDKIIILDNSPNSPIIKDVCLNFRISDISLPNYTKNIEIKSKFEDSDNLIVFNPRENTLIGKSSNNKYLKKYIYTILDQSNSHIQNRMIKLLISTIGITVYNIIQQYTKKLDNEKDAILLLNILNKMHFEEVRLILELIKRNDILLHKKLIQLPIHKEWFNKW